MTTAEPYATPLGRGNALEAIVTAVRSGERLVTLTGAGGVGKRTVAIAAARDLERSYAGNLWIRDLVSLRYPALLAQEISLALGLPPPARGAMEAALRERLAADKALLILSNLDHLLDAAGVLETLLDQSPGLQVIVTSSMPTGFPREFLLPIGPLERPDLAGGDEPEALPTLPAVQLFVARAAESDPAFIAADHDLTAIAGLCCAACGVPLAIELIAARCRESPPWALLELIEQSFLASGTDADCGDPERRLQAVIDWTCGQLGEPLQRLFHRLSLFAGGFDRDGAIAIAAAQPVVDIDLEAGLAALCDARLIHAAPSGRYQMLEPVRTEALRRLNEGPDFVGAWLAYARHVLDMAGVIRTKLYGPQQATALAWFDAERANLRGAVGLLIRARRGYLARSLVAALWPFWSLRRQWVEGSRWIEAALELFDPAHPDELEPELRFAAAQLALRRGDLRRARRHATEGTGIARADDFWHAALLSLLGGAAATEGDTSRALSLYAVVLKALRPMRGMHPFVQHLEAEVQLASCAMSFGRGELADAEFHASEAQRQFLRQGDRWGLAVVSVNLAAIRLEQGAIEQTLEHYQESLPLLWEVGDSGAVAQGLIGLARIAIRLKLIELSAKVLGAADALVREGAVPDAQVIAFDAQGVLGELEALAASRTIARGMETGGGLAHRDPIALIEEAIADLLDRYVPAKGPRAKTGAESLTRREREVLCLQVEGLSDQQIADALFIGYRTVTTHTGNVYGKLGVTGKAAAIAYAIRHELC